MAGGKLCDQAAVKEALFCRHHSTVQAALEREKAAPDPELVHTPIAFVYPEDRAAIQLNLFMVLQALNSKRIDNFTANTMIRALRSCELNLRKGALAEANREKVATTVVVLPGGDEVGMPREALESFDDAEEYHSLGCRCPDCEGKTDHLPKERHHAACHCDACVPARDAATGEAIREATVVNLHNVPPEPYAGKKDPEDVEGQEESGYQKVILQQYHETKAREQQEREKVAMEGLAAEYELRVDGEVKWKKGMKQALLEDFKQAMAEGVPYEPRDLAATASSY
ncbi:MAG TPA: hypothetical protein VMU92_13820 [Acidobacteriaceae bacterium]|nr:hypothetical protein [Acidobacteriaceae bacterium]